MGYIKENPIEEVDKPEKNQFVGKFYNSSELSEVIRLTKNTKLELNLMVITGIVTHINRKSITRTSLTLHLVMVYFYTTFSSMSGQTYQKGKLLLVK